MSKVGRRTKTDDLIRKNSLEDHLGEAKAGSAKVKAALEL